MKEKKARVEDAMHATKAAVEEGIVPGGGVALLRASAILESFAKDTSLDEDERLGVEIVRKAAEEPTRWIAQNAGLEGSVVAAKIKESHDKHWGFNAQTEQYEDLVKAGVIDPTKVVRTALTNAASIASLLLTTEALVSDVPEKEKPVAGVPSGARSQLRDPRDVRQRLGLVGTVIVADAMRVGLREWLLHARSHRS